MYVRKGLSEHNISMDIDWRGLENCGIYIN